MDNPAKIDWYRTPLDKDVLRKLTQKSDLHGWCQAGSFLLVYLLLGGTAWYFFRIQAWLPMVVACYVFSVFVHFMSMAAAVHELSHGTVFRTKALNELFYELFCFLTWNNPVHFRASHTYHHQLTVHQGLDKEVLILPVAELMNWKNYLKWFTFDPTAMFHFISRSVLLALGKGDTDYFYWDPLFTKDDPRRAEMIRFARFTLLGHLALMALSIYLQAWVLIYLVNFGVFFGTFLGKFCGIIQHRGLPPNQPDWRLSCHSVKLGPLLRYLYWNMNYHTEHHMYAAVPFYNTPALHEALKHDLPRQHQGLLATLRLIVDVKKKQATDPAYYYQPEFPAGAAEPRRAESRAQP